jgi:hypothetical protein
LQVDLNEERGLETTNLIAFTFSGWVTVFQPPWFAEDDYPAHWEIRQARRNEDDEEVDRAKKAVSVSEILETVPSRFHPSR